MCSYPSKSLNSIASKSYDYIIVGGGTAGCVLADRLSTHGVNSVLLIERGPVVDSWASRVPLISSNFQDAKSPAYTFNSVPLPGLGGRSLALVGGKALGGTSKLNGLIYSRSVPGEYNAWESDGRVGWGWKHVERVFEKSENCLSFGGSPGRGTHGPWQNQTIEEIHFKPVQLNVDAASSMGIPQSKSNDPDASVLGWSLLDATIDQQKHRCSTDTAFLPKSIVSRRKNLSVSTGAIVTSLDIEPVTAETDILRVVGLHLEDDSDSKKRYHVSCVKEVILCAGAIGTSQLLLLSGVGPQEHLTTLGIPVLKHLPGVGAHLQDHISVPILFKVPITDSIELLMGKPITAIKEFLKYLFLNGKGILGQQVQHANIILRSNLLDDHGQVRKHIDRSELDSHLAHNIPDIEVMFLPVNPTDRKFDGLAKAYGAFSYLCTVLKPKSFGSLRLASSDPRQQPLCDLGTLSDPEDFLPLRKALRLALLLSEKLRNTGYPLQDLSVPHDQSDAILDSFAKENAMSTYHYSSTCRMDTEDRFGVVDDELRVHGVAGLRIADASVFPQIPACHLQAPVVMVAERCAEFLLKSE
ncbi:GMC oxidoreductase [Collybia nuda]|uniref:GMC oxidoreductase n=1 Tax=Collybia nuda TaxID=64659 RepID=A0A9P5Y0U6_9AGAR|nr:GMC oxidoreductase [Collybia nuda]